MDFCRCSETHYSPAKPGGYLFPGMATIPMQEWEEPFSPEEALAKGTVFSSLSKPGSFPEMTQILVNIFQITPPLGRKEILSPSLLFPAVANPCK